MTKVGLELYQHNHGQSKDIRLATDYQTIWWINPIKLRILNIWFTIIILTKYVKNCATSRFYKIYEMVGSTIYIQRLFYKQILQTRRYREAFQNRSTSFIIKKERLQNWIKVRLYLFLQKEKSKKMPTNLHRYPSLYWRIGRPTLNQLLQ